MVVSVVKKQYVLISACRNEGDYIEGLIEAIAQQTIKPEVLLIVDDGSTDDTYKHVSAKKKNYTFLQICRMHGSRNRSFASQVYAANYGYEMVKHLDFDYIGFIDADIRVEKKYYDVLIEKFEINPFLGVVGGLVVDKYPDRKDYIRKDCEDFHVAGGVQFFRRACFEEIGGYIPIEGGGQDTIAEVKAMMANWKIKTFSEIEALHLRPDGVKKDSVFKHGIKWGRKFYLIGYHPIFYFGQNLKRVMRKPIIVGSSSSSMDSLLPH